MVEHSIQKIKIDANLETLINISSILTLTFKGESREKTASIF